MLNKFLTLYPRLWMFIAALSMLFLMQVAQWQFDGTVVRDAFWVKCVYAVVLFWLLLPFMAEADKNDDDDDDTGAGDIIPPHEQEQCKFFRMTPLSSLGFYTAQ